MNVEGFILVVACHSPQRFAFGVSYNSFFSADDHGMDANVVQMANQNNSIENRQSGEG